MRAMTRCASSLLLVVMWGCGPGGLTLGELQAPVLKVSIPPEEPKPWDKHLFIFLSEGAEGCPDLSSETKAFLNDAPVPLSTAGYFQERGSFLIATPAHCHSTSFMLRETELPSGLRDEVTHIRLTEGTTTFEAEAQHLCTPRSITMTSPAGGVLRPGDEVELEWQPATDALFPKNVLVKTASASMDVALLADGTLRVEGNRMRFRMPPLKAGLEGAAELIVPNDSQRLYRHHVTRCEGFTECQFDCGSKPLQVSTAVTVQAL